MSDGSGTAEPLFTYGTLQLPDVQLDTFGRRVEGQADVLAGFRLESTDTVGHHAGGPTPERHRIVRHTGDERDRVFGSVLRLSVDELDAADEYMAAVSRRIPATLASGLKAWVYVAS